LNVIEFGGGSNPKFRPNYDVRKAPNVDFVVDFERDIAIPDGTVDLIYSAYMVEHLSWRRVPGFLKECHRILTPNGRVLFLVPNLKEQAKIIASKESMTMGDVEMVFGSQEFEGNAGAHKSSMDPGLMEKLLKGAGFSRVSIAPHFMTVTDMVVEAWK
jgi:ubiquinone/menaquinone biosynthesis C-methylase UbiE